MKKTLALFPGQGSQKVGMGKDLYEAFEPARELFDRADRALGFSLKEVCFNGPVEQLTMTEIAQPAILTVSVICHELFKARGAAGVEFAAAAGHSLGEYSALVAAGALRFDDAVLLVNKRGRYMQEAVPVGAGKMVAVLGKEVAMLEEVLATVSGVAEIANVNAPGQVVVAGSVDGIRSFTEKMAGAKIIELQVSAPFHCTLMKPAEEALRKDLAQLEIKSLLFPVYANFSGEAVTTPEAIRESLARQVCGRVRWTECIENALSQRGIEQAIEFGHGNILTGLLKRIAPALPRYNCDSGASIQALAAQPLSP